MLDPLSPALLRAVVVEGKRIMQEKGISEERLTNDFECGKIIEQAYLRVRMRKVANG